VCLLCVCEFELMIIIIANMAVKILSRFFTHTHTHTHTHTYIHTHTHIYIQLVLQSLPYAAVVMDRYVPVRCRLWENIQYVIGLLSC